MITETVQYEDFDGVTQTKTLHFHIGEVELLEHLDILDEHEAFIEQIQLTEGKRELTKSEIRMILEIMKKVMKLAYGERHGDRHVKTDEVWQHFTQTPAYDRFLLGLFEKPERTNEFMNKLLPPKLVKMAQEARVEQEKEQTEDISDEELLKMNFGDMTPDQQKRAWNLRSQQS